MNWQEYWNQLARAESDPQRQVARVKNQRQLGAEDTDAVVWHLSRLLDLKPTDKLLDLCCGNGLLTRQFARNCERVVGIDLAPAMIESARQHSARPNVQYLQGNATEAKQIVEGPFDKIILQFSFQYLSREEGEKAVRGMKRLLKPGGIIVLGDVPDWSRLHVFYPSFLARIKYRIQRWRGTDQMGKFWSEQEMEQISSGLHVEKLEQPAHLPYSDYRVDYRLS